MPPLKEQSGLPSASAVARKKYGALDEGPIVGRKLCARKIFQAVGNPPALELILQAAIPLRETWCYRSSILSLFTLELADVDFRVGNVSYREAFARQP
jgi:hypothetical protein